MPDQAPPSTPPPARRRRLSQEFVARHQRARIVNALAEATVEKGYRAVTVAEIVKRAGVARNTFYDNFASKEDCFLAASEQAVGEAMRRVMEAAATVGEHDWPRGVSVGLAAFLDYVAGHPALARTCIVEALSPGPAAVERYEHSIKSFVPLFQLGREFTADGEKLPETLEETIVGGIFWIVYQHVVVGQNAEARELLPELVEFALSPYLGPVVAKREAAAATPIGVSMSSRPRQGARPTRPAGRESESEGRDRRP